MCGLVGFAGNPDDKVKRAFIDMLVFDSIRGTDSTGVLFVPLSDAVPHAVAKSVGDPYQLMDTGNFVNNMRVQNRVLLGHNRYSTVGKSNRANAHPFEYGSVIGAHNGTLSNKHVLDDGWKFDVDSQALYHHISKHGIEDAIGKANGAWALTWWDAEHKRINFLRNKERPLFFCFTEDRKSIFWASEAWMIEIACQRHGIKLNAEPFLFKEDYHFSYHINDRGALSDYREVEVKSNAAPFVTTTASAHHGRTFKAGSKNNVLKFERAKEDSFSQRKGVRFQVIGVGKDSNGADYLTCLIDDNEDLSARWYIHKRDNSDSYIGKKFTGDISGFFTMGGKDSTLGYYKISYGSVKLVKTYRSHAGEDITREEWDRLYGSCSWCQSAIFPDDKGHGFDHDGNVFCKDCLSDNEVLQYCKVIKVEE